MDLGTSTVVPHGGDYELVNYEKQHALLERQMLGGLRLGNRTCYRRRSSLEAGRVGLTHPSRPRRRPRSPTSTPTICWTTTTPTYSTSTPNLYSPICRTSRRRRRVRRAVDGRRNAAVYVACGRGPAAGRAHASQKPAPALPPTHWERGATPFGKLSSAGLSRNKWAAAYPDTWHRGVLLQYQGGDGYMAHLACDIRRRATRSQTDENSSCRSCRDGVQIVEGPAPLPTSLLLTPSLLRVRTRATTTTPSGSDSEDDRPVSVSPAAATKAGGASQARLEEARARRGEPRTTPGTAPTRYAAPKKSPTKPAARGNPRRVRRRRRRVADGRFLGHAVQEVAVERSGSEVKHIADWVG